jgi:hypothetical protein
MTTENGFAVVSRNESLKDPYPYVYVNDDGSWRELQDYEKSYLEERFHPCDGARPYVKFRFYSKTAEGRLCGFLRRSKLPRGLVEGEIAPPEPWWSKLFSDTW